MNLTDEQLIKALDTPYNRKWVIAEDGKGDFIRVGDLVDLIKRLQAENERLNNCVKSEDEVREIAKRTMEPLVREITREQIDTTVKLAKSEARKEFAERLRDELGEELIYEQYPFVGCAIDNILEEMEKKNNG